MKEFLVGDIVIIDGTICKKAAGSIGRVIDIKTTLDVQFFEGYCYDSCSCYNTCATGFSDSRQFKKYILYNRNGANS